MNKESAEAALREYADVTADRDNRIRRAHAAGVTKHRIHVLTGIARTTIDRILKEKPMATYTLIASNGREVDWDNPTPRWGYTHGEDAFIDEIEYQDNDAPAGAVARFQAAGKLPQGDVTVERGEHLDDYWIHEDHQCAYTLTITPTA